MNNTINLKIDGISSKVNIVRYFLNGDQRYLIFSLDEKDDAGYIKLYVCKMSYDKEMKAITISDEDEWNRIKELIKTTIKENRLGNSLSIIDLNYADINGIEVVDSKIFKLLDSMVDILGANKKIFEDANDIVIDTPTNFKNLGDFENNIVTEEDLKYKELYLKEIENRKLVEQELKKSIKIISDLKEKIDEIHQILN